MGMATALRARTVSIALLGAVLLGLAPRASAIEPASSSTAAVAACIRDPKCHRLFVVAHRAHGFDAPENSREAVKRAIQAGVPAIKIDVRASRDGALFVLHDGWLDRTTNLRGRIETFGAVELAQARLANGEALPRFEDLYAIARGRAVLTVGFKVDVVEQVAEWIDRHGSFDDVIFFVNTGEQMQAAARAKRRWPRMVVMVRLLDTRVTVDSTRAIFGGLPEIFHTERVGASTVARLHALGVKVFMNVAQWEGYVQPVKYLAVGWILGTGLDFVLTDEPGPLMRRIGST